MLHSYQFKNCDYLEVYVNDKMPIGRDQLEGQPVPPERYVKIEFNCADKKHAQAALDCWYGDVLPMSCLIPDFTKWLETHMSSSDAEKVIAGIPWYR